MSSEERSTTRLNRVPSVMFALALGSVLLALPLFMAGLPRIAAGALTAFYVLWFAFGGVYVVRSFRGRAERAEHVMALVLILIFGAIWVGWKLLYG